MFNKLGKVSSSLRIKGWGTYIRLEPLIEDYLSFISPIPSSPYVETSAPVFSVTSKKERERDPSDRDPFRYTVQYSFGSVGTPLLDPGRRKQLFTL